MPSGFKTSAKCLLKVPRGFQWVTVEGTILDVFSDGAQVLSEVSVQVGTKIEVTLDGFGTPAQPALIVENDGNIGRGYRLKIRLVDAAWPYQAFGMLVGMVAGSNSLKELAAPQCLQEFGLTTDCSFADLQRVFDERVRVVHPDRGGSVESFVALRAAYLEAREYLQ